MNVFIDKVRGAWRSWTIWFNGVCLSLIPLLGMLQDTLPALQPYVPDLKWMAAVVILGNVVLRFKTKSPLELK